MKYLLTQFDLLWLNWVEKSTNYSSSNLFIDYAYYFKDFFGLNVDRLAVPKCHGVFHQLSITLYRQGLKDQGLSGPYFKEKMGGGVMGNGRKFPGKLSYYKKTL